MSKISKLKASKSKLKKFSTGKIVKQKNKKKSIDIRRKRTHTKDDGIANDEDSLIVKKRPSKVELKSVIEELKKDATLIVVRKALKYIPCFLKSDGLTKKLLKEVIRLWAESSEKIRVICLLCLIRIYTKVRESDRKQMIIKKLYTTFLEKCRVTKQETMSMIGFMRHSLVELYKLDQQIAFKQAQSSCQQLASTLKNATTHKNEETYKSVLNWQFANCLILLSQLITSHADDSPVRSLLSQVIQLNLGAINLLISPRYYPFYCHLIENLIHLSLSASVFIPVLPLIVCIIKRIEMPLDKKQEFARKNHSKLAQKRLSNGSKNEDQISDDEQEKREYNIDLLNHVSLDESHCHEYNVAVLDKLYELTLLYLAKQSHKIAFPELVFLPCVQLKKWLRRNPGTPTHKFRSLVDKIKTDCERLEEARKSVDFAFSNASAVDAWQKKIQDSNKLCLPKLLISCTT